MTEEEKEKKAAEAFLAIGGVECRNCDNYRYEEHAIEIIEKSKTIKHLVKGFCFSDDFPDHPHVNLNERRICESYRPV
jgi:hypothetical protein